MKRLITLLAMYCIIAAAQAQNITNAEYFFDSDPGRGNGIALTVSAPGTTVNINSNISTTSLSTGFHFIGVRVKDATGVWGHFEKRGFYISSSTSDAANITAAEYFFDADPGLGNGTALAVGASGAVVNFTANIPTSLASGFHFLVIRVKGGDGQWGHYEKRGFYISSATTAAANITAAEYFLDTDPGLGNATALAVGASGAVVNFTANIPTSLASGFHFLAIRVKGSDGQWGHYEKRGFYISTATVDAANITAAEYFFDSDPGVGNATPTSVGTNGAVVNFTANLPTSLSPGFHFLAIRTKGVDGKWGLFEKRGFYVSTTATNMGNIVAAEYFFDADPGVGNATALAVTTPGATVTQTFLISEPGLSLGQHFFTLRVKDTNGIWSLYEYDTLNIGNSTISCPANATASAGTGECATTVNNIDPTVSPTQAYTYTLTGATTGTGTGTASGVSFNAGVTTVNYKLTGSPTVNCSFTVTVTATAPSVSSQPSSQAACAGNTVTFSVTAAGSGLVYQWRKGGVNIGSATSSSYSINNVSNTDAGSYDVVITNACGLSTTSSAATLSVGNTSITSQPTNQSVCAGASASFSVTAAGSNLSYQWRKGGVNITNANAATYTINTIVAGDAGNYDVVVTGSCGNATSGTAVLTINAATAITTNPASQTVCAGGNVTFTAAATGTGAISYQWRKGGVNITSANVASYTINGAVASDAANYDVVVTGSCGSATSSAATLTVNIATAITSQPTNQASCVGGSITFVVSATGTNVAYQWKKGGIDIPLANAASYTINSVAAGDAGTYAVLVTGACGSVTSGNATLSITAGTIINTQPSSQTACAGGSVTFNVSASGSGTVSYQWKKNGSNIINATSASYTINSVVAGDAANYTVVVSSNCGNTESNIASLTILPTTAVTTQPTNQTVCIGSGAAFSVSANGDNLTFQWRRGGVNITNANAASYSIAVVTAGDIGSYDVVITGTCGTATSSAVSLSTGNVAISSQPASQSVCAGNSVTFSVTATGTGLSYQWRKGGADIASANAASYTITNTATSDAANYDVVVTGSCGTVASNAAVLTVNNVPAITTQPVSQAVCAGSGATFTVTATGTNITYQWRKAGVDISGAISSSYTIANVAGSDAANYDVIITGTCTPSATSSSVALVVNQAPTITIQPISQTVFAGAGVTFTTVATGTGLSYQWRKDGFNIPGATAASYTINNVAVADAGDYDLVITGTCGTVTSTVAALTVNPFAITTQPASQSVCSGSDAVFNIAVSGTGLAYQWQEKNTSGTFTDITGATGTSLTINNAAAASNGYQYRCVINGSLNSNAATLTVNVSPAVAFTLPFDTLYLNSRSQLVSGGSPDGGSYSGPLSNGIINPGQLGLGDYSIRYSYTDGNGCTGIASNSFTIIPKAEFANIYPNPSSDGNVTVIVAQESVGKKASVFDAAGKRVYEWIVAGRRSQVKLNLPAGTYTIAFGWRYGYVTERIVITR
jgi:hypothetical protein